jgi:hypothetical protein
MGHVRGRQDCRWDAIAEWPRRIGQVLQHCRMQKCKSSICRILRNSLHIKRRPRSTIQRLSRSQKSGGATVQWIASQLREEHAVVFSDKSQFCERKTATKTRLRPTKYGVCRSPDGTTSRLCRSPDGHTITPCSEDPESGLPQPNCLPIDHPIHTISKCPIPVAECDPAPSGSSSTFSCLSVC